MVDRFLFAVGGDVEGLGVSIERYHPDTNTWEFPQKSCSGPYPRPELVVGLDGLLYFIGMFILTGLCKSIN